VRRLVSVVVDNGSYGTIRMQRNGSAKQYVTERRTPKTVNVSLAQNEFNF
jgi:hypothetical protein